MQLILWLLYMYVHTTIPTLDLFEMFFPPLLHLMIFSEIYFTCVTYSYNNSSLSIYIYIYICIDYKPKLFQIHDLYTHSHQIKEYVPRLSCINDLHHVDQSDLLITILILHKICFYNVVMHKVVSSAKVTAIILEIIASEKSV